VGGLPPGTATLTEHDTEFERVVRIAPSNASGCALEFRFSLYGTFGLELGRGLAFEDIALDDGIVLDICESVSAGCVQETVWDVFGHQVRTSGQLRTRRSGTFSDRGSRSFFFFFGYLGCARRRDVVYSPWC